MKKKIKYLFIVTYLLIMISLIPINNHSLYPYNVNYEIDQITTLDNEIENFVSCTTNIKFKLYNDKNHICSDLLDWGVDDIDAEHVWGNFEDATDIATQDVYTGDGITIAVLDTGIARSQGSIHTELTGKVLDEIDYANDDYDASDDNGHGTHCAGVIAAKDNDIGIIGVAPESSLLIAKIADEHGYFYVQDLIDGIYWATVNGANIISMSLSVSDDFPALHTAITYAYQSGVILVASSGNENQDEINYPSRYQEIISVGSISEDHTRSDDWIYGQGSNYGPNLDLVAPGNNIYSSYLENGYETMNGTSMACPHVAGLCALILEAQPLLTPSQAKDVLRMTATDLGSEGKDDEYGYGEVNATKAIDAAELYFTDTDGDDLSDAYEKYYYYTDRFDPDTDGDELSDYDEIFVYLTDPTEYDMDDDGLSDREELLIYDTNPGINDTDNDGLNDGDEVNTYNTDPLDKDSDDDILEDGEEIQIGTDPNDSDTDNDGMGDYIESYMGTNPLVDDAEDDPDSDGLTNYEELMVYHTLPFDDDTDNGGKEDGWEIDNGKNPLDPGDDNGGWFP